MLIVRDEQLESLSSAMLRSFERRMAEHLWHYFPEECRRAGDERVRAAIRQGVARAARYGIVSELDVARYIDLSVVLGLDFDSGRRHPWAKEILNRPDLNAGGKMALLLDRTRLLPATGIAPSAGARSPGAEPGR